MLLILENTNHTQQNLVEKITCLLANSINLRVTWAKE